MDYIPNSDDVGHFHQKFSLDNTTYERPGPRVVSDALLEFRIKFMSEELTEFATAAAADDHAKMFDALLDLVYVAMGTAHLLGYPWQDGWDEVQRANMMKERAKRAEDSKRGSTFDVIKPPGWTAPDIEAILRARGFKV